MPVKDTGGERKREFELGLQDVRSRKRRAAEATDFLVAFMVEMYHD